MEHGRRSTCRELGHTSRLWPFAELMRSLIEHSPAALTVLRESSLLVPELLQLLPELASHAGAVGQGARAGELGSKHRVFDAITRAITLASNQTALVLILDDLHRADPASLELLHYLLPELSRRA